MSSVLLMTHLHSHTTGLGMVLCMMGLLIGFVVLLHPPTNFWYKGLVWSASLMAALALFGLVYS